jgi:hypothetical protein
MLSLRILSEALLMFAGSCAAARALGVTAKSAAMASLQLRNSKTQASSRGFLGDA